jgi:hypothetical protein
LEQVVPQGFEQAGDERGAHDRLLFGERIHERHGAAAGVVGRQTQPVSRLRVDEAVGDDLGEPKPR